MAIEQFQQNIRLWGVNQDPKDSKESPLYLPGTQVLISLERWVPKGSTPAHMEGPLPCNTFYPHSSEGTRTWLLDSLIRSQAMEENRRGYSIHLSAPGRTQIIFRTTNECYSKEHPKIKFLGIRFLKTALKSQHILAGVVLQNRQEVDFLIPEQGGNWAILNETYCFSVNTSS